MTVIRCKMCGGNLILVPGSNVAECAYCGRQQTVPTADSDKKINLFERANQLRAANEFDKASAIFEYIAAEFPNEAEAYWGLVLCKYGISYVDDPATGKKIPTCNRSGFESVLADRNFALVMQYAVPDSKEVYQREAQEIEDIRKNIIAVSSREKPYDIFICFKDKDDDTGNITPDSMDAQDLYYQLTKEGYNVFFSRVTLKDKGGKEYEPYIFAALNSAKVMIVIGSKPQYWNAVWVRNEWGRFLALAREDKTKQLMPCFKGMAPAELPAELSGLQCYDMGKIGFYQDLLSSIKNALPRGKKPDLMREHGHAASPYIKRAFIFLGDGDFANANIYAEKALDIDPENAEAYLVKLMADTKSKDIEQLKYSDTILDLNKNYEKIMRFGDPELKQKIKQYNQETKEAKKDVVYSAAIRKMNAAKTAEQFDDAAKLFGSVAGVKDAAMLQRRCLERAEECRREAAIRQEQERQEQLLRQQREEQKREEWLKQQQIAEQKRQEEAKIALEKQKKADRKLKVRKGIALFFAIIFFIAAAASIVYSFVVDKMLFAYIAAAIIIAGFVILGLGKNIYIGSAIIAGLVIAVIVFFLCYGIHFYTSCERLFSMG